VLVECFVRERERERCCNVRYGIITMKGDGSERERGQEKGKGDKAVSVISYLSLFLISSLTFLFLN
jgi:hypothetical protein